MERPLSAEAWWWLTRMNGLPRIQRSARLSGVQKGLGGIEAWPTAPFPSSPLIEPDVRISRIRLSDRLHGVAHGLLSRNSRRQPSPRPGACAEASGDQRTLSG